MKTIMRIPTMRLSLLAFATGFMILFTGCQQEDLTANDNENLTYTDETQTRAPGPSASGQGTLSLEGIPVGGDQGFRHFTFQAREKNNGSADGNGVLTYTAGQLKVHFDIDCLNINGNTAIMSGVVTKWKEFNGDRDGWECWFKVEDNGEGNNADPDRITLFVVDPELFDCAVDLGIDFYEIEGGNIQVRE